MLGLDPTSELVPMLDFSTFRLESDRSRSKASSWEKVAKRHLE